MPCLHDSSTGPERMRRRQDSFALLAMQRTTTLFVARCDVHRRCLLHQLGYMDCRGAQHNAGFWLCGGWRLDVAGRCLLPRCSAVARGLSRQAFPPLRQAPRPLRQAPFAIAPSPFCHRAKAVSRCRLDFMSGFRLTAMGNGCFSLPSAMGCLR